MTPVDPTVDFAFKCLFGRESSKGLLVALLRAVLREDIADAELLNPVNDKVSADDKLTVLDVKTRLADGSLVNVEMQVAASREFAERSLYYWSKLYSGQLAKGEPFSALVRTVAVNFVDWVMFPDVPDCHLQFDLRSSVHAGLRLTDRLSVHTIELPKAKARLGELSSELESWCYFLKHAADLKPGDFAGMPAGEAIRKAKETLDMVFQTDHEREVYEARLRAQRDAIDAARWRQETEALARENEVKAREAEASRKEAEARLASVRPRAIVRVLTRRLGEPSAALRERIAAVADEARLDELLDAAATAASMDEFEKLV